MEGTIENLVREMEETAPKGLADEDLQPRRKLKVMLRLLQAMMHLVQEQNGHVEKGWTQEQIRLGLI